MNKANGSRLLNYITNFLTYQPDTHCSVTKNMTMQHSWFLLRIFDCNKKEQATIWRIINDHRAQNHPPPPKKEQATIWKIINDHRAQTTPPSPLPPQKRKKNKRKSGENSRPKSLSSVLLLLLSLLWMHM